ncbi:MAG: thermonuclease family protein [Pseudomonadota bacterium]
MEDAAAQACREKLLLQAGGEGQRVMEVLPGGILKLDGGRMIKPAGILLPQRPLNREDGEAAKSYERALGLLRSLMDGQTVTVAAGAPRDRHGREVAQLVISQGRWLQAELVERGFARVDPETPGSRCAEDLLKFENSARSGGAGLWPEPAFQIRPAWADRRLRRLENTFQIVEGKVAKVAETKRFTYLNFGKNWRTDFTAAISARSRKRLGKVGFKAAVLKGRTVRIRGWITYRNGPMIEVTRAGQIELLGEPGK